jgi:M6 family metalloprotease-like protein
MKKLILSAALLLTTMAASAVPAKSSWKTITQSDGAQLRVMLMGDENFHYYKTTDGVMLIEEGGSFYYANATGQTLVSSSRLAHELSERSTEEQAFVDGMGTEQQHARRLAAQAPQVTMPRRAIGEANGAYEGSKKGIIILVSFSDLDFVTENPRETFEAMVNQPGYTNSYGAMGSVHDYFYDQSYGRFDLTFDVVGPYKAPKEMAYYGKNQGNYTDVNIRTLIKWAMRTADNDVNYADYDWDGDKEVDQVFIVYAGYGEAQGAPAETIWPHESVLGGPWDALMLDNVTLNTYACGQELAGKDSNDGTRLAGIGTICHEFSHCMGLPDFYDTDANTGANDTNYGTGTFDLMCGGSYNGNSWKPAAYTGYERNFCGWLDYQELTDPCRVKDMQPITDGGPVFVTYNPANKNEYYLYETRTKFSGWDQGLYGSGLLIYHVNYIASRWKNNTVNKKAAGNPCMQVVAADNNYEENTAGNIAKDLWPSTQGIKKINEFSDTSTPACTLFNKNTDGTNLLHIKLSNIKYTASTRTSSFTFNDGTEDWTDPSGIEDVTLSLESSAMPLYNLRGQRVSDNAKGLLIRNGKKFFVK